MVIGGGAEPQAGRVERLARVERHGVVVQLDRRPGRAPWRPACPRCPCSVTSIRIRWLSVPPDTRSNPRASSASASALALATTSAAYSRNVRLRRLRERDRDAGGRVVVRATLQTGEDGLVERLGVLGVGHQHRAARAAQRLVRGGGDDLRVPDRRRVRAARDQAGDVRDVGDQHGADLLGDLRERREVDRARDGRATAEDQLRPLRQREVTHLVEVDAAGVLAHAVLHRAEPLAGRGHATSRA